MFGLYEIGNGGSRHQAHKGNDPIQGTLADCIAAAQDIAGRCGWTILAQDVEPDGSGADMVFVRGSEWKQYAVDRIKK